MGTRSPRTSWWVPVLIALVSNKMIGLLGSTSDIAQIPFSLSDPGYIARLCVSTFNSYDTSKVFTYPYRLAGPGKSTSTLPPNRRGRANGRAVDVTISLQA